MHNNAFGNLFGALKGLHPVTYAVCSIVSNTFKPVLKGNLRVYHSFSFYYSPLSSFKWWLMPEYLHTVFLHYN